MHPANEMRAIASSVFMQCWMNKCASKFRSDSITPKRRSRGGGSLVFVPLHQPLVQLLQRDLLDLPHPLPRDLQLLPDVPERHRLAVEQAVAEAEDRRLAL